MAAPSTIRAWQYTSTKGGIENNLKLNTSAPLPEPKPNQHLVQVIAAALNPVDYKPAEVPFISRFLLPKPATPGIDIAGVIVAPAAGSLLKPGQRVFGAAAKTPFAGGGLSEYTLVEKDHVIPIPDGVDPIDAAGVCVAGLTAYQSTGANAKKGDSVFINGGSGGTGVFGIQIAKARGCHVVVTCSSANVELCKSLGADEALDYTKGPVLAQLIASGHKFDRVVDNVGTDWNLYWKCHEYTKPGAEFIMVAGNVGLGFVSSVLKSKFWPGLLGGGKRKFASFWPDPRPQDMEQIGEWMQEGKVKLIIDQRFSFEQVPDAFKKLKTGRAKGKIVIEVNLKA